MKAAIDILGSQRIVRRFERVALNSADLSLGFRRAFSVLESRAEQQFDSEGAQTGGWPPLAPSTLARKTTGQMLVETGRLRDSLTSSSSGDAIREVGAVEAAYGTRTPYAHFHHQGTSRMPRRPLLFADEVTKRLVMAELQRALFAGAR